MKYSLKRWWDWTYIYVIQGVPVLIIASSAIFFVVLIVMPFMMTYQYITEEWRHVAADKHQGRKCKKHTSRMSWIP